MEQDLDPLDVIKGTRECCYTLWVLKIKQQVDYLHKATESKPIGDTQPQRISAALQLMTHSHSHFWPLTSLFLCIPTSSHCIVCWKPQPSFFSFLNTSLAILLLHWAFFHLSTHLSCSPTHISTLSPQCLHECVRLYTITLTCFTSQTKSLFCRFYFWFCPLQ